MKTINKIGKYTGEVPIGLDIDTSKYMERFKEERKGKNYILDIVSFYAELKGKELAEVMKERKHFKWAKDLYDICDKDMDTCKMALEKTKYMAEKNGWVGWEIATCVNIYML